jgi:NAD(P)-dependent dehydrogenase (short-subunit alcohol dehydrogenase family)
VTGASRGIGAAIAQRLASEGARVAVTARTLREADSSVPGSLQATVEAIHARGGSALPITADLADPEQQRADIVRAAARELGPIDILVNNAAANFYDPLASMTEKRFRIAVEVNLRAPLELAQAVAPGMRERGAGWILNISSASAERTHQHPSAGTTGPLLYVTTKAALERATVALAEELFPHGIAVNALAPQAGVRTAAAEQYYQLPDDAVEPVETMAAAAVALCTGKPQELTGRITRSLEFLVATGSPVHCLDGESLLEGWQPHEIDPARLARDLEIDESEIRSSR